jgi:photosystem II stability/assembly factor-like uncharacterized protein
MYFPKRSVLTALGLSLLLQHGVAQAATYVDVLQTPAKASELAIKNPLLAVTSAGDRLVTVGVRGHILYSDDAGNTWRQASVPVSSDLTAVHFSSAEQGWAVGHDGVVLHSADGGETWQKQLDGFQVGELMVDYFSKQLAALPPPSAAEIAEEEAQAIAAEEDYDNYVAPPPTRRQAAAKLVDDATFVKEKGADKPFLDVWFQDEYTGWVVGAFGLAMQTSDGGKSWTPVNDKIDNPQGFHLIGFAAVDGERFIVGEAGLVLRLNWATGRFESLETPYEGSFFGVTGKPGVVIIYGLRGHAFASNDKGNTWKALHTGLNNAMTASAVDELGIIYLMSQAGHVLRSTDSGKSFQEILQSSMSPIAGATAASPTSLALVGRRGVRVFPIE